MAGTPTTNYSIPTYADTDAPDLSGAYNDAMDIIDTQLKANADAIESASTGNYKGAAPITVDNEGRIIGINTVTLDSTGEQTASGIAAVTGKASAISTSTPLNTAVVPNSKAVADYVESKMAAAGAAYTGTAPIVVDNGSHAIRILEPQLLNASNCEQFLAQLQENPSNYLKYTGSSCAVVDGVSVANDIFAAHDSDHNWPASYGVPNLKTVMGLIPDSRAADKAGATQQLTVDMLKNLWVNPTTGSVFYKAPSE